MTKYPQGSERQLIYATTKRAINSTMLPADAGCIVDNTETLVAIERAVKEGIPLIERMVTITGDAIAQPGNFLCPTGTSFNELIEASGGFSQEPEKVISGGPMMGFAVMTTEFPVTKTSSALLCFKEDPVSKVSPSACINCGRCVDGCPSRIVPSRLADFAEYNDQEQFEAWNGLECVECGSCTFICPARRNLAQSIRAMKKTVIAAKRSQK
jgi:electron transport complex protein RnfC